MDLSGHVTHWYFNFGIPSGGRISIFSRSALARISEFFLHDRGIRNALPRAVNPSHLDEYGKTSAESCRKYLSYPRIFFPRARIARKVPFLCKRKHRLHMMILNWIIIVNCCYANVIRALGSLCDAAVAYGNTWRRVVGGSVLWRALLAFLGYFGIRYHVVSTLFLQLMR